MRCLHFGPTKKTSNSCKKTQAAANVTPHEEKMIIAMLFEI